MLGIESHQLAAITSAIKAPSNKYNQRRDKNKTRLCIATVFSAARAKANMLLSMLLANMLAAFGWLAALMMWLWPTTLPPPPPPPAVAAADAAVAAKSQTHVSYRNGRQQWLMRFRLQSSGFGGTCTGILLGLVQHGVWLTELPNIYQQLLHLTTPHGEVEIK